MKLNRGLTFCLSAICVLPVFPQQPGRSAASEVQSTTQQSRIHPSLLRMDATETRTAIVMYADESDNHASDRVQERQGMRFRHNFSHIPSSVAELTRAEIEQLAQDPEVKMIAPDGQVKAFGLDYGNQSVGAYTANSDGYTGAGIGVAFIDSGISYEDCDFKGCNVTTRYGRELSFIKNLNGSTTAPDDGQDYYGHGTHVASIAGGSGTFSTSYVNQWNIYPFYWIHGVATGITVHSLRVLNSGGIGTDSSTIAAIDYAIENKAAMNLRVINMSIGRSFTTSYKVDPLCQAVEQAWKAGIVVVVAAGNEGRTNTDGNHGYGTITAPGNDPYVITVGAVNTFGSLDVSMHKVTSYSSKGPTAIDHIMKPDLVAPGDNIYGTQCLVNSNQPCPIAANNPGNMVLDTDYADVHGPVGDNWFLRLSGTSMATPVISGAAALMIGKQPSLTPDQVKTRLMETAWRTNFVPSYVVTPVASGPSYMVYHDLFTIGAGEVNVMAALNSTITPATNLNAQSPGVTYNATLKILTIVPAANSVWTGSDWTGGSSIWGLVSSSAVNPATSTNVMWGSTTETTPDATALTVLINGDK